MTDNSIGVLTLNVEGYRRFFNPTLGGNPSNFTILDKLINQYNPDVLLLQEDILPDKIDAYPNGWQRIAVCESHISTVKSKPFCNSILVRPENAHLVTNHHKDMLDSGIFPERCFATIEYKGLTITTLHLSGGRYEDDNYAYANKHDLRNKQSRQLIGADIIAGDFNSNPNPDFFPKHHPTYTRLHSDIERQAFRDYFISGHQPLLDAGYVPVPIDIATDIYGGNPDACYYNPKKLTLTEMHIIPCLEEKNARGQILITDHNGIYCQFLIRK